MSELFAFVALLLFLFINAAIGIRLLRLASRTRELPELALGIGHLLGGALGWALIMLGSYVTLRVPSSGAGLVVMMSGLFSLNLANVALTLFNWQVFNPTSKLLGALFVLLALVLATDFVHNGLMAHEFAPPTDHFWYWPGCLGRTATYVWMTIVTLRYYRKLRLRLPLGLADPVTANRMFLVFLAASCITLLAVVVSAASVLDIWNRYPHVMWILSSLLGLPSAIFNWLAFVPPRRYTGWIARRAAVAV